MFRLSNFRCPQSDDFFPLLGKFPRTFGTPPQAAPVNELVVLAAIFAIEMHFVSPAPAEIPELRAFVQTVQFCPDCFMKNVVVTDEQFLRTFPGELCAKPRQH
jgi:hypothetical protein